MAYFPFYVNLQDKIILIAGGGGVAAGKVRVLLGYGASIVVIAPQIEKEIFQIKEESFGERLKIKQREFQEKDLMEADMVIAATNLPAKNSLIYELCKQKGKPVNVVDVPEECDFIFPAILKKKGLTVAVSTGGKSPLFAATVKQELDALLPDYYGELAEGLGKCRKKVLTEVSERRKRRNIFKKLIEKGKNQNGKLTKQDIESAIEKEGH